MKMELVVFSIKKSKENHELFASFIGYNELKFNLLGRNNYDIEIFLNKGSHGIPIHNQIDSLKLSEFENDRFKTINNQGQQKTWKKDN